MRALLHARSAETSEVSAGGKVRQIQSVLTLALLAEDLLPKEVPDGDDHCHLAG